MHCLEREFYRRDTLTVAKELIGKYLVREYDGLLLAGRITETEAYIGAIDKACHAFGGRKTARTSTLYEQEGTAYVYFIYGMYYCMNVVTEPEGTASAVLLRGVEMVKGLEAAARLRYDTAYEALTRQQIRNFSNGPGKLCKAMAITKELNRQDLCSGSFYITDQLEGCSDKYLNIATSARIGIDYAEEAKEFPWRFHVI